MADISSQTLRVLRAALELGAFTMPQLTDASGASYETVKRVLRRDRSKMFSRTGETVARPVGRPAELWKVVDEAAIRRRLEDAGQTVEPGAAPAEAEDQAARVDGGAEEPLERHLAAAEDVLLLALAADSENDAIGFAEQALDELSDSGVAFDLPHLDARKLGQRQNVQATTGRAWVVTEVARYLGSREAKSLAGPRWRRAFAAIAAVDSPEMNALHKRFLVGLVRVAIERSESQSLASALPLEDLVEMVARASGDAAATDGLRALAETSRQGSEADRQALRLALAQVLDEVADGSRQFDRAGVGSLLGLVPAVSSPDDEMSGDVTDRLVAAMHRLSRGDDAEVAARAAEALVAMRQPTDPELWVELATSGKADITPAAVLEMLGRMDPEAGFSFFRAALDRLGSLADARDSLVSALPAIEAEGGESAREAFAEFLASLPGREREYLLVAPALAGVEPVRLDRHLTRRFVSALVDWSSVARGDETDPAVIDQIRSRGRDVTELAAEVSTFLGDEELARATDVLAQEIATPEAAAISVPAVLALGGEATLARCMVERASREDEPWDYVARWYLEVSPRGSLDDAERETLFDALLAELRADMQDRSFLLTLAQRALEKGEELPELTESSELSLRARFELERTMTADYANETVVEELEEIAAVAV